MVSSRLFLKNQLFQIREIKLRVLKYIYIYIYIYTYIYMYVFLLRWKKIMTTLFLHSLL
ncbi:hypothetical protein HanPSC8_Chr09g0365491 [Helianthus annuus]|nr:hypothetical protein HanPSC8_Chr09g0365491 [Helianthus annuus]